MRNQYVGDIGDYGKYGLLRFLSKDLNSMEWTDRTKERSRWHGRALSKFSGVDIVFADPDNALSATKKPSQKDSEKYILPSEIKDYYDKDIDLVYYHHRSRAGGDDWLDEKRQILKTIPEAKLLAVVFRRWSQRVYIFVLHKATYMFYKDVIQDFLESPWGAYKVDGKVCFTEEEI